MTLVDWVRVCVEDFGAPWPKDRIGSMCRLLVAYAGRLRTSAVAVGWMLDLIEAQGAIARAIDLTDRRAVAGPCPERTDDSEPCPGMIFAVYPVDENARPRMECTPMARGDSVCGRTWPSEDWRQLPRAWSG